MTERLDEWMDRYTSAWYSNDADEIAELFSTEAVYDPQVEGGPWHGRDQIIHRWLEIDDTPGNWEFEWQPIVETDDMAVVKGHTRYTSPPASYRNLFVIRFDSDGRCVDFTEWWIDEEPADEEE